MENILNEVKLFAQQAHSGQKRKYSPDDYIVHPVRVMNICSEQTGKMPVLAAALLHDVLEDTSVTKEELKLFLHRLMPDSEAQYICRLVDELTDIYVKKDYPKWNRRKRKLMEAERIQKTCADAQTIKYADIIDNCREIVAEDPDFANVFIRECKNLLGKMTKGNPTLYKEAVKTVNVSLQLLLWK